jgi:2-polyprenyl-3-methyl-5-hydroxy-6-metoxy-1,4-benzoquinol methylase
MIQATGFHRGRHLGIGDIDDARVRCPICHSARQRRPVYRIQRDPDIEMLACSVCGAASASHMPKPGVQQRYYAEYYANASEQHTFHDPMRFARHVLRAMPCPEGSNPLRILDFGGGDGSLAVTVAQCLRSRGVSLPVAIDVIDYSPPRRPDSPHVSIQSYRDLAEVEGSYDVILASAIFEHIPDAHTAIHQVTARAGPRAYMYARTPSVLPLAQLIPVIDMTYPAHVHDMGSVFWGRFVATFGLAAKILSSRPSLVETTFARAPARTVIAQLLKAPAVLEQAMFGRNRPPLWGFVGGWEAVIQFD